MEKQARITSKGQITVPREVRRILGVRMGDYYLKAMRRVSASGAGNDHNVHNVH